MNGGGVRTCEIRADRGDWGAIKGIEPSQHPLLSAHLRDLPAHGRRGCLFFVEADGHERKDDRGSLRPCYAREERRQNPYGSPRWEKIDLKVGDR